ncbi:protein translocase subunit SecD [Janibacter cremeus]|uniref:protein translocase subunit SecD n=1 Tax=Janibacter cremeus TaxID=1285192 RepID=UPI0023F96C39|nr:protein translocase subunit SecD [Janibacter cremeus]WEV79036.1 protein translocase subunit SecD [Janibacter cremeus]
MEARRSKDAARKDNATRTLIWLFVGIFVLIGALGYGVVRDSATWAPRLGLDLAGGTQIILEPRVEGEEVSPEQLSQARDIIVQRIDSQGTTGAEVTTQGDTNIVVAVPGSLTEEQEEAISASSQMQFRPVLATALGSPQAGQPTPSGTESPTSGGESPTSGAGDDASTSDEKASDGETSDGGAQSVEAASEPTEEPTSDASSASEEKRPADDPSASQSESPAVQDPAAGIDWSPSGEPTGPMDPNHVSKELWEKFQELDCSKPPEQAPVQTKDPIVACGQDGQLKYVLGPVVVPGKDIADAEAGYQVSPQGAQTNTPEISLTLTDEGREAYKEVSTEMVGMQPLNSASPVNPPASYNALAAVLDSQVLIAPGFNEAIPSGRASITGFDIEEARSLAQSLKFGALPMSFDLQTRQDISPTLGSEQLRLGIIAGIIGLFIVLGYALLQYRALASVVVGSMVVAFGITYLAIALLSWGYNYRLDMAGVTGLIIAIGVTADSFIVYFERVRDELREGRNLRAAVEAGWARAKGTILVADGVNVIAAVVLYVLASSGVRGFAFTLGLTTLIDLAIFWLFTHPMLTILARNKFFASGHPWSGFDVNTLREAKLRYRGRGQVDIDPAVRPAGGTA